MLLKRKRIVFTIVAVFLLTLGIFYVLDNANDPSASSENNRFAAENAEKESTIAENGKTNRPTSETPRSDTFDEQKPDEEEHNQLFESNAISPEQAVQYVKDYLQLHEDDEALVEVDHEQETKYLVHVYDIIAEENIAEHHATRHWFLVDKSTGEIEPLF